MPGMRALVYVCPKCGSTSIMPNETALKLVEGSGACQACRLDHTLRHLTEIGNLELLEEVMDFTKDYKGFRVEVPQWLL